MTPLLLRLLLVVAGVAAVALLGWLHRRRDGRLRRADTTTTVRVADDHLAAIGLSLDGADAGAVLLGSPSCGPCVTVKRILGEVADTRPGFRWVYADAGEHLDLARAHGVQRVPTLLVLDADARLVARTSGVPDRDALRAVLDDPLADAVA